MCVDKNDRLFVIERENKITGNGVDLLFSRPTQMFWSMVENN